MEGAEEPVPRPVIGIERVGQGELGRQKTLRNEAGLDLENQCETPGEESGAHGQNQRKRCLRDHEPAPELRSPWSERTLSHRLDSAGMPERGKSRGDTEGEPHRERSHEHEKKERNVELNLVRSRKHFLGKATEDVDAPAREDETAESAHEGEEQTLGQELTEQAPPPCPERDPELQLAHASARAEEQQVGDIGANDPEDERDRDPQHPQGGPDLANDLFLERKDIRPMSPVDLVLDLEPGRDHAKFLSRFFDRDVRTKPRDDPEVVERPEARLLGTKRERNEDHAAGRRRGERGRHDSHDLPRHSVDEDRASDGGGGTSEETPRERIGEDRDLRRGGLIVGGLERSSERRVLPKHREEIPGYQGTLDPQRVEAAPADIDASFGEGSHRIERAAPRAPVDEVRRGDVAALAADPRSGLPDLNQGRRAWIRKGVEEHASHDGSERAQSSDSECERRRGRRSETPLSRERSKTEADISKEPLECHHDAQRCNSDATRCGASRVVGRCQFGMSWLLGMR